MRKQEYMKLVKTVCEIMKSYNATQDQYGAYYINTPCGELRVSVEPFKPRREYTWLYTRIQHPERVNATVRRDESFNEFSGKFNTFGNAASSLYDWLQWYICELMSINCFT